MRSVLQTVSHYRHKLIKEKLALGVGGGGGKGSLFEFVWNMRRLSGPPNSDKISRRYWIWPEFL